MYITTSSDNNLKTINTYYNRINKDKTRAMLLAYYMRKWNCNKLLTK